LSADGNTLAAGAPYNDGSSTGSLAGHVRVYSYNDGSDSWSQRGSDIDNDSIFSESVSL
jgi:hypothetical protein